MLSYPFAFGYALVLVVLDVYPLRRFSRGPRWWRDAAAGRIWLEKVPFVLLGGLVLLTLLGRLNPAGVLDDSSGPGPGLTVSGKGDASLLYLGLLPLEALGAAASGAGLYDFWFRSIPGLGRFWRARRWSSD